MDDRSRVVAQLLSNVNCRIDGWIETIILLVIRIFFSYSQLANNPNQNGHLVL